MKVIGSNGKTYSLEKNQAKEVKEIGMLNSVKFHSYKLKKFAFVLCTCAFYCK